jgi:molybdate-binding protein/DNA-binding XRE family transcriptional regulator
MSKEEMPLHNRVKQFREERGWSQQELAERAGLSRAGVSSIEIGKLVPSTAAALALSRVLGCRVEELFQLGDAVEIRWAWPPPQTPCRYWQVMIGDKHLLFPVESSPLGMVPHDGVYREGKLCAYPSSDPCRTLLVASCDPAVGLLASEYARTTHFRMLVFSRSSRHSLQLLRDGFVHVAGLHLAESSSPEANARIAQEILNAPARLLRVANWQEGVILPTGLGLDSIAQVLASGVRWVGREPGSGARQVLDEVLQGKATPSMMAKDHRGVVDAVRSGWAEAGVSLRLMSEEAGLDFITVREEAYDLCIPKKHDADPRVLALIEVVQSRSYRNLLGELPGYDASTTGTLT